MRTLRLQIAVTVVVTAAILAAVVLSARMMVSDGRALLISVLVLGAGIVVVRVAGLVERQRERAAGEAARRRLVAAVSHDLRTPLAALTLLAEAIDDDIVGEDERGRYMAAMRTHVGALSAMVDDLFELSRIEAGDVDWAARAVGLAPLVEETVTAMSPEAHARHVRVTSELAGAPLAALADPERIQRVLFNLIRNAIHHTPAGGSVVVAARSGPDGVEVEVADSGSGIAAEERERVFDSFYRGAGAIRPNGDGAGLGLAIARAIVEAHGGRIWLAPTGAGTRVCFTLPAAPSG